VTCPRAVPSLRSNRNSGIPTEYCSTKSCKLALTASLSPPQQLLDCARDGQRDTSLRGLWGDLRIKSQVYERRNGTHFQQPIDPSVDSSGWTPLALEQLIDLTARLSFMEASELALRWGVNVGHAELERLTAPIAATLQTNVETKLRAIALQPLALGAGRVVTVEIDGVIVLGQPEQGNCGGIEVKSVVIAPFNAPSQRTMLAGVYQPARLEELLSGLLRAAGVRATDRLIGVSDGAIWIEQLFQTLGVEQVIDVYHALEYAGLVMTALGWSAAEQVAERRLWCTAEINVAAWLEVFAVVVRASAQPVEVLGALSYLEARAGRMAYKDLKWRGLPIGSGQVEGMNKSVIGSRLKRSGMHWSRGGASRMSLLRSQVRSRVAVLMPMMVRFDAFPTPHP
jgi:hypothetical protein